MENALVTEASSDAPIKVEVTNFDNIRDNALKMVVAAVAVTVVTEITKNVINVIAEKRKARKAKAKKADLKAVKK